MNVRLLLLKLVLWPFFVGITSDDSVSQSIDGSLYFFAHGDWGKGGYTGDLHDRRTRSLDADDGGGYGNGAEEGKEEEHEEHEDHHEDEVFYQMETGQAMQRTASRYPPSFILALGDNFYQDGVYSSTDDPMWQTHFKWVYFNESDALKVPWHAVIGNHDLGYGDTGIEAQINRTNDTDDDMWQTPAQWYTIKYAIPNGGFVQVVCVDTTWLAPSENEATNEEGGISTDTQAARIQAQLSDLHDIFNHTLVAPRPTWLIVAGHYNIHSAGEKGDNDELITYLVPLMEQYGVHAYICGHDHVNEHLQNNGIEYFVAGASSMNNEIEDDDSVTMADLKWAGESFSAFALFEATIQTLTVRYISSVNHSYVYNYSLTNPNEVEWTDGNDDIIEIVVEEENDDTVSENEEQYYLAGTFRSIFIWAKDSEVVSGMKDLLLGIFITCSIAFVIYMLMRYLFVVLTTPSKDNSEGLTLDRDMHRMDDDDDDNDDDDYGFYRTNDLESPTRRVGDRHYKTSSNNSKHAPQFQRQGLRLSSIFSRYKDYELLQHLKSLENTQGGEEIDHNILQVSSPASKSIRSPTTSDQFKHKTHMGPSHTRMTGATTDPTESDISDESSDDDATALSSKEHSSVSFADLNSVDKKAVSTRLRSYLSNALLGGTFTTDVLSISIINEERESHSEDSSLEDSTEQGHPTHQVLNLPPRSKQIKKSRSDSSISSLTVDDTASSTCQTSSFNSRTRQPHERHRIFRHVSSMLK